MKKYFVFVIFTFSSALGWAENILIRATGASPVAYDLFLKQSPQSISYVDYLQRKLQNQPEQERKIFALADSFTTSPELTLLHLKGLQASAPWTLMSLRFVRDLAEKSLGTVNGATARDLKSLYCKTAVLLNEGPLAFNCPTQFVSLENLRRRFPKAEKLMIESLGFALNDLASPSIAAQMSYHWTFVSNSGKAVSFFGTYDQVFQQSFAFDDLVNGTCEGFSADFNDIELQSQALIFFAESCQKKAATPHDQTPAWYQNKKTWWASAGAVVLGGVIYSLKDKKVVVNAGGLKF